jgi:hypothetical protein
MILEVSKGILEGSGEFPAELNLLCPCNINFDLLINQQSYNSLVDKITDEERRKANLHSCDLECNDTEIHNLEHCALKGKVLLNSSD